MKVQRGATVILLCTAVYSVAYGFLFGMSPLGLAPQLDSRELLELAFDLSRGSLSVEPFYRAMGYPLLLSLFFRIGLNYGQVVSVALLLGVILHLLNTALVMRLSQLVWRNGRSGILSGLLFGLNPVVVFFTVDVLDVGLGLFFALAGLSVLFCFSGKSRFKSVLFGGFILGISFVVRPHFLFVLPAVLLATFFGYEKSEASGGRMPLVFVFFVGLIVPMLVQSLMGFRQSGNWEWMPWQGAYNLYAANETDANGKYFKQKYIVSDRLDSKNPARAESEIRYGLEAKALPPYVIDEMNAHWRNRFFETIKRQPLQWVELLLLKSYYTLNDFEQYNNKTYSFHAARNGLLSWNPLSFGWMLVLGVGGLSLGWTDTHKRKIVILMGVGVCYGLSLLLFYASARFRIPIHALLAIFAGGFLTGIWRKFKYTGIVRKVVFTGVAMLLAGWITFSSFQSAGDKSTYIQDRMLLAGAGLESGDDVLAAEMAKTVMEENPERLDACRIYLIAYFNLMTGSETVGRSLYGDWSAQFSMMEGRSFDEGDYQVDMILGLIFWHAGFPDRAIEKWEDSVREGSDQAFIARGLLRMVRGDIPEGWDVGMKDELGHLLEKKD